MFWEQAGPGTVRCCRTLRARTLRRSLQGQRADCGHSIACHLDPVAGMSPNSCPGRGSLNQEREMRTGKGREGRVEKGKGGEREEDVCPGD